MDDGERATWPQLPLIRSLCEIEFCLDEVAADLQRSMASARAGRRVSKDLGTNRVDSPEGQMRGKLPSYVSLAAYGDEAEPEHERNAAYPVAENGTETRRVGAKLPGVASHASLLNLASLEVLPGEKPPSTGLSPFAVS